MLTLHTACPVPSEPLSIPRLCLNGRAPPRNTTVDLTHIDVVPNMNLWPLFHNGVAAGLRIAPSATNIDTAWIIFNKPKVTYQSVLFLTENQLKEIIFFLSCKMRFVLIGMKIKYNL